MSGFDDYEVMPSGLVRFRDQQGQWTPGFLPTVGQVGMWRSQIDAQRRDSGEGLAGPVDPALAADLAASREQQQAQRMAGDGGFAPPSASFFDGQGQPPAPAPKGTHAAPAAPPDPRQFGPAPSQEFFAAGPPAPPPAPAPHAAPAPGPADRPFAPPTGAFAGGSPEAVVQPPTPMPARMPSTDRGQVQPLPTPEQAAAAAGRGGIALDPATVAPAGDGKTGAVKFSDKGKAKPGMGGAGAGGPREMLAGRSVSLEGKWSPETMAEQEGVIRDGGALQQRGLARGLDREQQGYQQEEVQAKLAKTYDDDIARQRIEQARVLGELAERRQAKLKEIEEGKYSADFWKGASTGQTVAAALFTALGSFGQALAGEKGPSQSLAVIQKAIDDHLALQEKNTAKKQWEASELGRIYALEKERTGDTIAARLEAKAAALAQVAAQAKRLAALKNSEDAAIAAQQIDLSTRAAIADLHAKAEDRIKEVRQYKTVMPGGGGGAPKKKPTGGVTIRVPGPGGKGYVDKYFTFPAGMSEGQKADFMKRAQGLNNAHASLDRIDAVRGTGLPIADGDAQAFAQSFTYEYAEGKGQGQATADQEKSVAGKVRGVLGHKAIDAYRRSLDDTKEELIRQLTPPEDE